MNWQMWSTENRKLKANIMPWTNSSRHPKTPSWYVYCCNTTPSPVSYGKITSSSWIRLLYTLHLSKETLWPSTFHPVSGVHDGEKKWKYISVSFNKIECIFDKKCPLFRGISNFSYTYLIMNIKADTLHLWK